MSIEYRGVIVIGYNYDEAFDIATKMGLETLHRLPFDMYQPSYDAPVEYSIFGTSLVKSGDYDYTWFDPEDMDNTAKGLSDEYEENFGIRPKVYLMAQGQ